MVTKHYFSWEISDFYSGANESCTKTLSRSRSHETQTLFSFVYATKTFALNQTHGARNPYVRTWLFTIYMTYCDFTLRLVKTDVNEYFNL